MQEWLSHDDVMSWVLVASVYFMFCARCWRDTAPGRVRRKRRGGHWSVGTLILVPLLFPAVAPSIVTVALIRRAQGLVRR